MRKLLTCLFILSISVFSTQNLWAADAGLERELQQSLEQSRTLINEGNPLGQPIRVTS